MKNIIDTVSDDPTLSMLASIIKSDGLAATLSGAGPYTLFAPTNSAFAKIDPTALKALISDKERLGKTLQFHVVTGAFPASALSSIKKMCTMHGADVSVQIGGVISINNARLVTADIKCANGVIHTIDTVLTP